MKQINIQAAKTHLSRLVEEAAAGEEIVLAKAGKPIVTLTPFVRAGKPRKGGQLKGKIWASEDCWKPEPGILDASIEAPLVTYSPCELPVPMVAETKEKI